MVLLAGCSLDDRSLRGPSTPGTAGEGGGEAGAGPSEPGTTLERWPFDDGTDGWHAEMGVEQRFSNKDASDARDSGSLEIVNTISGQGDEVATAGTSHCLAVREGHTYHVSFAVYLDPNQPIAGAGFALEFFNAEACHGLLRGLSSHVLPSNGDWQRLEKSPVAPDEAESVLFRLVVNKLYKNPSALARFDDVRFAED
jgi:hypothetical protein